MAYSEKLLDHYENPRNVGSFAKDAEGLGTGMVGAPACGDVMKLQSKVQDLRLRFGHRIQLVGDRVGQGQDRRSSLADQEHADRGRTGFAAGEDTLLDPGGRCHQSGSCGLQSQAWRKYRNCGLSRQRLIG
jgi:hypothetical protein